MPGYEKTKQYFKQADLYCYLIKNGTLQRAIENAKILCDLSKQNPEDELSYSGIYRVFELLNDLNPMES
jgi:hypothetical protein